MAGEHPHDCPPDCIRCERDDAWQALCDDVGCDAPVLLPDGRWRPCWQCARCEAEAEAFNEAIQRLRGGR